MGVARIAIGIYFATLMQAVVGMSTMPLAIFEKFGQTFNDTNFKLGKEWRDSDGNLLKANVVDITSQRRLLQSYGGVIPSDKCGESMVTIDAARNRPELKYQFSEPTYPSSFSTQVDLSFCMYMEAALEKNNMNFNGNFNNPKADTSTLTFSSLPGVECENCYSFMGSSFQQYIKCDATFYISVYSPDIECVVGFTNGGGVGFNMDMRMDRPAFQGYYTWNAYEGEEQELYSYMNFKVLATPKLDFILGGDVQLDGDAKVQAAFETSATLSLGVDTNADITLGLDESIKLEPPVIDHNLYLKSSAASEMSVYISVKPIVDWKIGWGVEFEDAATIGTFLSLSTHIEAKFEQTMQDADNCGNQVEFWVGGSIEDITAEAKMEIGGYSIEESEVIPVNKEAKEKMYQSDATFDRESSDPFCLASWSVDEPAARVGTGGEVASLSGVGDDGKNSGGNGGAIAAVIIVLILLIAAIVTFVLYKKGKIFNKSKFQDSAAHTSKEQAPAPAVATAV